MNKRAFSLIEFIITIAVIAGLASAAIIAFNKIKSSAGISSCAENLKNIAAALEVYANDYKAYPRSGAENSYWSSHIGWRYDKAVPDFMTNQWDKKPLGATVSSCWYLLVRYRQMYPYQFVCKSSGDKEFTHFSMIADFRQIWDFGDQPQKSCSYSLQNPFGKFSAKPNSKSDMPIAADKSPFFDSQNEITNSASNNSKNHQLKGQNVLFADMSVNFITDSHCGINKDDIYTYGQDNNPPTDRKIDDAVNEDDSFLVF